MEKGWMTPKTPKKEETGKIIFSSSLAGAVFAE